MNTIQEIKFNAIDLGPLPQMIRTPSHNAYEEVPLILDGPFLNTPNDFVMPEPCEKCHIFMCDGICSEETELIPRQLSFEEEMNLPPPPPLTRIYSTAPLRDEVWKDMEDVPLPCTRMYTNADLLDNELLVTLSEAEFKTYDEYEAAFFKALEDKKHKDQDKDK